MTDTLARLTVEIRQAADDLRRSIDALRDRYGDEWLLMRDMNGAPLAAPLLVAHANALVTLANLEER